MALIGADLCLAFLHNLAGAFLGIALWGVHLALSQGLLSKLIADRAPAALRASAFGIFNLFTGLMLLAASVLAGLLWASIGPSATFLTGAAFCVLSLLLVAATLLRKQPTS